MFAYIDPAIRERLVDQGKLVRIDELGNRIDVRRAPAEGTHALNILGPIPLPVMLGERSIDLQWYAFVRHTELAKVDELARELRERGGQRLFPVLASAMSVNSVLVAGDFDAAADPLVRVHSSCLSGDVFGSQRCDCGPQYVSAIERIADEPSGGLLVYMAGHEGRGIGLWAKAVTYLLQDAGENTYQANRSLGLPDDSRDFTDAAAVLHHFVGSDASFRLLTNNPKKVADLQGFGLTKVTQVKHIVGVGDWNRRYLAAKRDWGHLLDDHDLQ
ncbi:MAG: GTP cyclohydrolase II [Gammaproteobacteria bacterium]|nr:GTP cyclohydrolase II [Gammaproteobacteria bacterium]